MSARCRQRIAAMRTDQVNTTDGAVHVTFNSTPIQMPPLLDDLLQDHLTRRGQGLYVSRDNGWLFPGGSPGQHLSTLETYGWSSWRGRTLTQAFATLKAADLDLPSWGQVMSSVGRLMWSGLLDVSAGDRLSHTNSG